jgi:hypothetical protein
MMTDWLRFYGDGSTNRRGGLAPGDVVPGFPAASACGGQSLPGDLGLPPKADNWGRAAESAVEMRKGER